MRFVGQRCGLHDPRIKSNLPHQRQFRGVGKAFESGDFNQTRNIIRQVGKRRPGIAEDRLAAGMAVLDVEYRIVARLLDHLGQILIQYSVILAE